jgi:hypothetical protein
LAPARRPGERGRHLRPGELLAGHGFARLTAHGPRSLRGKCFACHGATRARARERRYTFSMSPPASVYAPRSGS